jgi:hypothetical protein
MIVPTATFGLFTVVLKGPALVAKSGISARFMYDCVALSSYFLSNLKAHSAELQNGGKFLRNGSSLSLVNRTVKGPEAPNDGDSERSSG